MVLSILQLPNELLIGIISTVSNADFESFILACKGIHALARTTCFIREHRIRRGLFRSVTYGEPSDPVFPGDERTAWTHPTLMLLDLLHDDLLCYPRVLSIKDYINDDPRVHYLASDSDSEDGADPFSGVDDALTSFANDLKLLIQASPLYNGNEELSRGILEGDITTTLGLLLNVLPNLKTLQIWGYRGSSPGTGSLNRILDSMLITSRNPPRGSVPPLGKLECVVLRRHWTPHYRFDDWTLSTYAPLFYFPSVHHVSLTGVEPNHSEDDWTYPGALSHVNCLEFKGSNVNVENLKAYLKTTQNLLHFKYQQGASYPSVSPIREIVQTVLDQAGHSLRHLIIQSRSSGYVQLAGTEGHFVGSMKAFQVLETIQVAGSMLFESVETREQIFKDILTVRSGRTRRLIDILPPSIVRIMFDGEKCVTGYGIGGDLGAMLQGLPEGKADLLPRLEIVAFGLHDPPKTTTVESEILHACSKAGVKIVIQRYEIWEEDLAYVVHDAFYHKGVRTHGFLE